MMKKIALLIIFSYLFLACSTKGERYLGKKSVKGTSTLFVKFFQKDEYDMVTPLHYEIVNSNDSILVRKTFLLGTHDKLSSTNDFYAEVYDSIFFISYPTAEEVCVIKDLKKDKRKLEDLFPILKSYNKKLREM